MWLFTLSIEIKSCRPFYRKFKTISWNNILTFLWSLSYFLFCHFIVHPILRPVDGKFMNIISVLGACRNVFTIEMSLLIRFILTTKVSIVLYQRLYAGLHKYSYCLILQI